jgi:hypothetical protein
MFTARQVSTLIKAVIALSGFELYEVEHSAVDSYYIVFKRKWELPQIYVLTAYETKYCIIFIFV